MKLQKINKLVNAVLDSGLFRVNDSPYLTDFELTEEPYLTPDSRCLVFNWTIDCDDYEVIIKAKDLSCARVKGNTIYVKGNTIRLFNIVKKNVR